MEKIIISSKGIHDFIKAAEGLKLKPYICAGGYATVGYGHRLYPPFNMEEYIDLEQAEHYFIEDIWRIEQSILRNLAVKLKNHQFDALVSFVFNVGGASFQRSQLRSKINREEFDEAAEEFMKWIYAGGRKLKGLITRRTFEAGVFAGKILLPDS